MNSNVAAVNSSESSFLYLAPASSPASSPIPAHDLFVTPFKEHHRAYQLALIPAIGIIITGLAILLLLILIILIQRKNRQLNGSNSPDQSTLYASSYQQGWKNKKGTLISCPTMHNLAIILCHHCKCIHLTRSDLKILRK